MPISFRARTLAALVAVSAIGVSIACSSGDELNEYGFAKNKSAIIGGKSDTTDTFVVGINIGGGGLCTGTLIAPNLVLTARHCVSKTTATLDCNPDGGINTNKVLGNYPASSFRVTQNQDFRNGPFWTVKAIRYINDATCSSANVACRLCGYDLALLQLNPGTGGAFPTTHVPPSNIPPKKHSYEAIGYGCQKAEPGCDPRGYRMLLNDVSVGLIDAMDFWISGRVCGGDSGGPVYNRTANVIYGALSRGDGTTSAGEGCNYGAYTRTDVHMAWLQKYGAQAAKEGGYTAPPWVTAPPPPPDAGVDTGAKQPLGTGCTSPANCETNLCINFDGKQLCSQMCSPTAKCPAGFQCLSGYCWPGEPSPPPPPPEEDTGVGDDAGIPPFEEEDTGSTGLPATDETLKSTCTYGPGTPPPKPQPWIAALGLAIGLVVRRRLRK